MKNKIHKKRVIVHDYQSGVAVGKALIDWGQYVLWANGPSKVCEAFRILNENQCGKLGISSDTIIFCY